MTKLEIIQEIQRLKEKLNRAEAFHNEGIADCTRERIRFLEKDLERENNYEALNNRGRIRRITGPNGDSSSKR